MTKQWILACRNSDGGFGLYPGDGSNLLATFCAVKALKLLGAQIDGKERVSDFIFSKQRPEGGFCNRFGREPDEPVLQMTYYAVAALSELGRKLPECADWIRSRQQEDGGFLRDYWQPEESRAQSSTLASFYALSALKILGKKPKETEKAVTFLNLRQTTSQWKDGSFNERDLDRDMETPAAQGLVWFTGMGLKALKILGATCAMPDKAADYLKAAQRESGGIGKGMGRYHCYDDRDVCRIQEAYYASMGLAVLGQEFQEPGKLTRWIASTIGKDRPIDLEAVYQALYTLSFLKAAVPEIPFQTEREPDAPVPEFRCKQVNAANPDENRYLYRIAKPIYDKNIASGEFAVAKAIMYWVNDNLLFCSNYNHSGAQTIIDGLATCGPQGRAYTALANSVGIRTRAMYIHGHGLAESLINGKWVMMDPMFCDWGRDETGALKSGLAIHENFLDRGRFWTCFGDWRYEVYDVEMPDGEIIRIERNDRVAEAVKKGAYQPGTE